MFESPKIVRLLSSLSFRLQGITLCLSLVGVLFGVKAYFNVVDQYGADKSLSFYNDLIFQIVFAILLNILAAYVLYRIATKPIRELCEIMRSLTEGNLAVDVPYTEQPTEIGSMSRKVAVFKQNAIDKKNLEQHQLEMETAAKEEKKEILHKLATDFEKAVSSVVDIVASSAVDMQANAKNLSQMADHTSAQSSNVVTATEQTSSSVETVASAVEQLSASIGEINYQVAESTRISNEAVVEVRRADATISTLSDAATQIGDVVKLIQAIAAQTNLLALNATIEAARAGEAGKGFAVVASEVKNLAKQTAQATEEIVEKINMVQSVSSESVNAIRSIGKIINQTSDIAKTISNAIQQQTVATKDISHNVEQVSLGTAEVTNSIVNVTGAATQSRVAAGEVLDDSTKLLHQAEHLKTEIAMFLGKVRQA